MRNRRKAVSLLTGLLVTAQLFPTAALAADSSESALNKAPGYQDFPAYYSDSAHADDQVTHPDVVVLEEPWNGYRYWMAYTPYPGADQRKGRPDLCFRSAFYPAPGPGYHLCW